MINALTSALAGLQRARERFAESADRISRGDIDVKSIVDSKINAQDVKLQTKNLAMTLDREKEIIDLLA